MNALSLLLSTRQTLFGLLDSNDQRKLKQVVALGLFSSLLDVAGIASILPLITILTGHVSALNLDHSSNAAFIRILLAISGFFVLKNLLGIWIQNIQNRFAFDTGIKMSRMVYTRYFAQDILFFRNKETGMLMSNIFYVPNAFASGVLLSYITAWSEISIMFLIGVGLVVFNWKLFLVMLFVMAPSFFLIFRFLRKKVSNLGDERNSEIQKAQDSLIQGVYGNIDARLLHKEEYFIQHFLKYQTRINRIDAEVYTVNSIPPRLMELFAIGGLAVIVLLSLFYNPQINFLYLIGVFGAASFRMMPSVNRTLGSLLKLKNHHFAIEELLKIVQIPDANFDKEQGGNLLPFTKSFLLKNISYKYPDGKKEVLDEVCLDLQKGEKIGIMGESGTGKSTLINILLGLLRPSSGQISLDGVEVNNSNFRSYQKKIGYVKQDVFIWNGSLEENIAFGTPKEAIDLEKVNFLISTFNLEDLRQSIGNYSKQRAGEKGAKLSGGQKQRIAIARAMYHTPEILILDEATSSLDLETEKEINNAIEKLSDGKLTIIIVSHQLSALQKCQRLLILQNGKLINQ